MAWTVERWRERPSAFHARTLPERPSRAVWVCEPTSSALVLGSAQGPEVVDAAACEAAGIEVVRRRSGGGAVLVVPGELLWLDLVLPSDDDLWDEDVGRAFGWVGDLWHRALADVGVLADVHAGGLVRTAWSSLVCFAGLGPGELTNPAGAKIVGIAQRRTRTAARFQCAALHRWDPVGLAEILALDPLERARAAQELTQVAAGVPVASDRLLEAVLHHLP